MVYQCCLFQYNLTNVNCHFKCHALVINHFDGSALGHLSHIHPSIGPWVSNARLTIVSMHLCLAPSFSEYIFPRYTILFISSSHALLGRPFVVFPYISPNITFFTSLFFSILQM